MNKECKQTAVEHIVQKAIIMAAGIGKRLQPLTLDVPKPLIKVNGVSMIDTVVNALKMNGIEEIYVVVGHLKEQFYEWAKKQENVEIIENPYYATYNNISSLYCAREHLGNCIIVDGDQIVNNPKALDPHFSISGYNAVWRDEETDEWMMQVENGIVKSCCRDGGSHAWQLYSVSRWTEEDGNKLRKHLEQDFIIDNKQLYWDDLVMFSHFTEYRLGIREMSDGDIIEIDNLFELIELDENYETYKDYLSIVGMGGIINE